jgi:hypothetical protein
MRIYWDDIRVARVVPEADLEVRELRAASAELRRLGYPSPFRPDDRQPALYTYDRILDFELWGAHEGYYTRYGDVTPLLDAVDDRFVITHHGDEILLGFEEVSEPPRPGWKRSFLVVADGFGKDMDLSSAFADTLEPLPFHGMSRFPYGADESYPSDPATRRYREQYNTRYVGKDEVTPFGRTTTTP